MCKIMYLRRFEDGGNGGNAGGNGGQGNAGGITYSFEQAEQIATDRANRATQAALKSYFAQQGMSESEVTQAINDYRQKQAQNNPATRNAQLEQELAAANKKLGDIENKNTLAKLGVSSEYSDFVAFEVAKNVTDKKDFETAAKEYIKDHPAYTGNSGYKVSTGVTGGAGSGTETNHESINNMIRGALGRR